jgi:hypothetical protein
MTPNPDSIIFGSKRFWTLTLNTLKHVYVYVYKTYVCIYIYISLYITYRQFLNSWTASDLNKGKILLPNLPAILPWIENKQDSITHQERVPLLHSNTKLMVGQGLIVADRNFVESNCGALSFYSNSEATLLCGADWLAEGLQFEP